MQKPIKPHIVYNVNRVQSGNIWLDNGTKWLLNAQTCLSLSTSSIPFYVNINNIWSYPKVIDHTYHTRIWIYIFFEGQFLGMCLSHNFTNIKKIVNVQTSNAMSASDVSNSTVTWPLHYPFTCIKGGTTWKISLLFRFRSCTKTKLIHNNTRKSMQIRHT